MSLRSFAVHAKRVEKNIATHDFTRKLQWHKKFTFFKNYEEENGGKKILKASLNRLVENGKKRVY